MIQYLKLFEVFTPEDDKEWAKAIDTSNIPLIKEYISKGYPVNKRIALRVGNKTTNHPALFKACFHYKIEVLKELVKVPDIDINGDSDLTPLIMACANNLKDVVSILLQHPNIDVNKKDVKSETAIYHSASFPDCENLKKLLSRPEINVNPVPFNPLISACRSGIINAIKVLLQHPEIDVNITVNSNMPLFEAVYNDGMGPEILKLLLQHPRININKSDTSGWTPLMVAVNNRRIDIVRILLESPNIKINLANNDGDTALSLSEKLPDKEINSLLIQKMREIEPNMEDIGL